MPAATLHIIVGAGKFTQSMPIILPDNDINLSFQENCDIRQLYVSQKCERMRAMYYKQIIKCQHEYYYIISCKAEILTNHSGRQLEYSKYLLQSA